jgi:hypothetical protein
MLQKNYLLFSLILIIFILNIHNLSRKNKFRITLLVDGIINKVLLGILLCIILFENFLLGILFMIFLLLLNMENQKKENIEGFSDYFKNIC